MPRKEQPEDLLPNPPRHGQVLQIRSHAFCVKTKQHLRRRGEFINVLPWREMLHRALIRSQKKNNQRQADKGLMTLFQHSMMAFWEVMRAQVAKMVVVSVAKMKTPWKTPSH